jgi:hypothetical protein
MGRDYQGTKMALSTIGRMTFGFAYSILSFADSNVEYLLGKLGGIAWTLRHGFIMPRICRFDNAMEFQTEALP